MRIILTFALLHLAAPALAGLALADGGDTFEDATELATGSTVIVDNLFPEIGEFFPVDTVMHAYVEGVSYEFDDDDSPLGNTYASAVGPVPIGGAGLLHFAISGYDDINDGIDPFNGSPFEEGPIIADLFIMDGATTVENFQVTFFLELGEFIDFQYTNPNYAGAGYDYIARLDNLPDEGPGDVDFYRFTGLTPGDAFSADIALQTFAPVALESTLWWFDESGEPITSVEGGPTSLDGVVPSSGEVVLAVGGMEDTALDGSHRQQGLYQLSLTTTPTMPGDYDGDGSVTEADYNAWVAAYGSTTGADGNGDGLVDAADYTVWRDAYAAAGVAVPEPGAVVLVAIAIASMASPERQRRD